jgi:hypothetical protein
VVVSLIAVLLGLVLGQVVSLVSRLWGTSGHMKTTNFWDKRTR